MSAKVDNLKEIYKEISAKAPKIQSLGSFSHRLTKLVSSIKASFSYFFNNKNKLDTKFLLHRSRKEDLNRLKSVQNRLDNTRKQFIYK